MREGRDARKYSGECLHITTAYLSWGSGKDGGEGERE